MHIYFLSRLKHDTSDLHEIMSISFNMEEVLLNKYNNINKCEQE